MNSLLTLKDINKGDFGELLELAKELKKSPQNFSSALNGKTLALIFEKPSTRTRVSFEAGIYQLGGNCIYPSPADIGLGTREPVKDIARVISRYVDIVALRTFKHSTIEEFAKNASVPVINGLSDLYHPCQALADMLTIVENFADPKKTRIVYLGDGNNVCLSLIYACNLMDVPITVSCPKNLAPKDGSFNLVEDPVEAVKGADVVYTDVWTSMGDTEDKSSLLAGYGVDSKLFSKANDNAIFLHCLPAKRGEEVSDEVIESPSSKVFDQAENRLHVQKAIILKLLNSDI